MLKIIKIERLRILLSNLYPETKNEKLRFVVLVLLILKNRWPNGYLAFYFASISTQAYDKLLKLEMPNAPSVRTRCQVLH